MVLLQISIGLFSFQINPMNFKLTFPTFLIAIIIIFSSCTKSPESSVQSNTTFGNLENSLNQKLAQFNAPAISVAIIKNEKLVYLKAFGFSDNETKTAATATDIYRVASISKPITLAAILKLVQDGTISLDQKVFGVNGILGNDFGIPPPGSNKDLITIKHLLDHKSGWTNTPTDLMFTNISKTKSQLISELISTRALTTVPGTSESYLNIGYHILGRVIEKVTNQNYENYVKTAILAPSGIVDMKIAGNTLADRYPNEVKYYQTEFSPYSMNINRMDAGGGWVATAKDLAKFIVRVDQNSVKQDLISTTLMNQFYFGYANWYFYGSLPGTSAIVNRLNNSTSFVVITNTRTESNYNTILDDLNNTMIKEINSISNWPTLDLF